MTGPCRICANEERNAPFTAVEMMLGIGDRFDYLECGRCGALQIQRVPGDLSPYYAPPYYSFAAANPASALKRWLRRRLADHVLGGRDILGWALARAGAGHALEGFRAAGVDRSARVLDVGAGGGHMLFMFHDYGFRNLLGIDPYIPETARYENGIEVRKAGLEDMEGEWDLIMFHHSFEHVTDPLTTLTLARERLAPDGRILIRMPVAAASWRAYGPDWVELDAPRHLHVHTHSSLDILAEQSGLQVLSARPETSGFELWGSEQYQRGIPLTDPRSHAMGGRGEVFGRREMRRFAARARALNRSGEAGRAAFWLRRSGDQAAPSSSR